jgi:hypothetical protein
VAPRDIAAVPCDPDRYGGVCVRVCVCVCVCACACACACVRLSVSERAYSVRVDTGHVSARIGIINIDPGRTRTCNLWFRRPTPYPLGHRAIAYSWTHGRRRVRAALLPCGGQGHLNPPSDLAKQLWLVEDWTHGPTAPYNGERHTLFG